MISIKVIQSTRIVLISTLHNNSYLLVSSNSLSDLTVYGGVGDICHENQSFKTNIIMQRIGEHIEFDKFEDIVCGTNLTLRRLISGLWGSN